MKKAFSLFFTLVYLQVNVAWAGAPTLPLFSLFRSGLKPKAVIVFHSLNDDIIRRQSQGRDRSSKTPVDKIAKEKAPEEIKKGRRETTKDESKNTVNTAAPSADLLAKKVGNQSPQAAADLVVAFAVGTIGPNVDPRLETQLGTLVEKMGNNNFKPGDSQELREANKTLAQSGIQVSIGKAIDGSPKLEVQRVIPTIQAPQMPTDGSIPKNILANVANPASLRQTAVRAGAGNSNFGYAIRQAGFNGRVGDIDRGSIKIENGTRLVRSDDGNKFIGKVAFTTNDGIKFTVEGTAFGKVTILRARATQDATFVEVDKHGRETTRTFFKAGNIETRQGDQFTFNAKNGAILRENFGKPDNAQAGGNRKPPEMKGSVGEYIVRENGRDFVHKMINGEAIVVNVKDSLTGQALAKGDKGQLAATAEGVKAGLQASFKVQATRFDANGSMYIAAVTTHKAGDKVSGTVEIDNKGSRADGQTKPNADPTPGRYSDAVVTIHLPHNGKMVVDVVAVADNATIGWTLTSQGMKLDRNITGERMTYENEQGTNLVATAEGVMIQRLDVAGEVQQIYHPTLISPSASQEEKTALRQIGVQDTMPVPVLEKTTDIRGIIQIKDNQIVDSTLLMRLENGAQAQTTGAGPQMMWILSTVHADGASTFGFGQQEKLVVPQGRSDIMMQNGQLQAESAASLVGVRVETKLGGYTYKQAGTGLTVENVAAKPSVFAGRRLTTETSAPVVAGTQVFFKVNGDGLHVTRQPARHSDGATTQLSGAVKYVSAGLDGRLTGAMEADVTEPINLPKAQQGAAGGSVLVTPGAITQNIIDDKDTNTIRPLEGKGPSTVAVSVVDAGNKDANGRVVLDAQFNVFSADFKNIVAGKGGMDFAESHFSEGMSLTTVDKGTIAIRVADQQTVMTTADGATYEFDANTVAHLGGAKGFSVETGRVVHTESTKLNNLPQGLSAPMIEARQIEHTPGGSRLLKEGNVRWETTKPVEIPLSDGSTILINDNLTFTTHSTALVGSIMNKDVRVTGQGGITIRDPEKIETQSGLKATVETPQEIRIDAAGDHVSKEGLVRFEVIHPNGYIGIDEKIGAGLIASGGARFTARNILMDGLEVQTGRVKLKGVKEGTREKLADGVVREVFKQGVAVFEAGKKPDIKKEETVIKGDKGASLVLDENVGRTLRFDEAAVLVQEGAGFRLHETSAVGSKFSVISEQANINGDEKSVLRSVVSQEKLGATRMVVTTNNQLVDTNGTVRQNTTQTEIHSIANPAKAVSVERKTQIFDVNGKERSNTVVITTAHTENRSVTIFNENGERVLSAQQRIGNSDSFGSAVVQTADGPEKITSDQANFGDEIIKAFDSAEMTATIGGVDYKITAGDARNGRILDGQMRLDAGKDASAKWKDKDVTLVTGSGETARGTAKNIRTENGVTVFNFSFSAARENLDAYGRTTEAGHVFMTGVRFTGGAVSHRLGDMVARDGTRISYEQGNDGLKLDSQENLSFDFLSGQVTQTIDKNGRATLQTTFTENQIGRDEDVFAIAVTNQGFERGVVALLPSGSAAVDAGGVAISLSIGEGSVGLRRLDQKGELAGEFLVTSDAARSDATGEYFIEAGTVISQNNKGELEKIKSGSVRVDIGGHLPFGKNNYVNALTGGTGGASDDNPEIVLFDVEDQKKMVMKEGRALIWTDSKSGSVMGFKPGAVFINQDRQYQANIQNPNRQPLDLIRNKNGYKQRSVLTTDDETGKMVLKHAVKSDANGGEAITADLRERGRFWEVNKSETQKDSDGNESYSLIVLDADYRMIGTYTIGRLDPISEMIGMGDVMVVSPTDRRGLGQGSFITKGTTPVKDKNGNYTSDTMVYGDGQTTKITTRYYADMTPIKQTTTSNESGETIQVGYWEKNVQGKWGWTDSNKEDNYDPVVALAFGLRVRESNLDKAAGMTAAVGAVALAPFTGGVSLIALAAAGTFGYLGASASINSFKSGDDWMGAFYMFTAFLPVGLGAVNRVSNGIRGMLGIAPVVTLSRAASGVGTMQELIGTGVQLIGSYVALSLAFDTIHAGHNTFQSYEKEGWGEKTKAAAAETGKNFIYFSIGYFARAVSVLSRGTGWFARTVRGASGFGREATGTWGRKALAHQTAFLSLMGGSAFAANHFVFGAGDLRGAGREAAWGAGLAGGGFLLNRLFSLATNLAGNTLKIDLKTGFVDAQKLQPGGLANYLREAAYDGSLMIRDMGAGATAGVVYKGLRGWAEGKPVDWSQAAKQGAVMGFLFGGAFRAMSNWNNAFDKMNGAKLKTVKAFNLVELKGIDAFNWERVVGGFTMGVWEVAFNSAEFTGAWSFVNPFAWANGVGKLLGQDQVEESASSAPTTLGLVFEDLGRRIENAMVSSGASVEQVRGFQAVFGKFSQTFVNIAILYPFFSLERPGKNPVVDLAGNRSSWLRKIGEAELKNPSLIGKSLGYMAKGLGWGVQKTTVMPLTIKTFGLFESAAEAIAVDVGLLPVTDNNQQDGFNRWGIRILGFANAPIHPDHETSEDRYIRQDLEGGRVRWLINVPFLGRLAEGRLKDAMDRADKISSQDGQSYQFNADGKRYGLSAEGTVNARRLADELGGKPKGVSDSVATTEKPAAGDQYVVRSKNGESGRILLATAEDKTASEIKPSASVEQQALPEPRSQEMQDYVDAVRASMPKPAQEAAAPKPMDLNRAIEIVRAEQSGVDSDKAAANPEQRAEARARLGMQEGDVLVKVTDGVRRSSYETFVDNHGQTTAALINLKDRSLMQGAGSVVDGVGDVAVQRLGGNAGFARWLRAKDVEFRPEALSKLGEQRVGLWERLTGRREVNLAELSMESRKKLREQIPAVYASHRWRVVFQWGRGPVGLVFERVSAKAIEGDIRLRGPTGEHMENWSSVLSADSSATFDVRVAMTGKEGVSRLTIENSGQKKGPAVVLNVASGETHFIRVNSAKGILKILGPNNEEVKQLAGFIDGRRGENTPLEYVVLNREGKLIEAKIEGDDVLLSAHRQQAEGQNLTASDAGQVRSFQEVRTDISRVIGRVLTGNGFPGTPGRITRSLTPGAADSRLREDRLNQITAAFRDARDNAGNRVDADTKGRMVRELAQNASSADKEFFNDLVRRVDESGCSACFVKYTDPLLIADAVKNTFEEVERRVVDPSDNALRGEFVLAHLVSEAKKAHLTAAEMATFLGHLDAAVHELRGQTREAEAVLAQRLHDVIRFETPLHSETSWVDAKTALHKVRAELILEGKSARAIEKDARFKEAAKNFIEASGYGDRVAGLRAEVDAMKAGLSSTRGRYEADTKHLVDGLDVVVSRLERSLKNGDVRVVDALKEMEHYAFQAKLSIGAEKMDVRAVRQLRSEIDTLKTKGDNLDRQAAGILTDVVDATEVFIRGSGADSDSHFKAMQDKFEALRALYQLKRPSSGNNDSGHVKVIDQMLDGTETFEGAARRIFGVADISELTLPKRMALELAVSDRFFQTYKNGEKQTESVMNKKAAEEAAWTLEEKDAARIADAKRSSLLMQFMVGRLGGLAAGGGKTPVFIMGLADYVIRAKASGQKTDNLTGELVVFGEHEVQKYIDEYLPLFRAFGLKSVDGRNLAGERVRKEAEDAFTAGGNAVKIVVSDLHSRGFLERQLRAEPGSKLAQLVRQNVKTLGLDEVEASLLSRLSFISSDGNLVATDAQVDRVEPATQAVVKVLSEKRTAPLDLKNRDSFVFDAASGVGGYLDVKGGKVPDTKDGRSWYTNKDGEIIISDAFMAAVKTAMGGKEITTGEIQQVIRALDAVGNENAFGFARGEKGDETSLRPTHKNAGKLQHGQIDSSVTFNIAAVLFERLGRERHGQSKANNDNELSLKDIKLSDAGSMATFVQVLQRDIHRFGATGTPEAILGLAERVIGVKVVNIEPSSYDSYKTRRARDEASMSDAYSFSRLNGEKEVQYLDKKTQKTADLAGWAINQSLAENAGILIGSPKEAELREALYGYMERRGGSVEAQELRKMGLSIRHTVERARALARENNNQPLLKALEKVRVIDGNENSEVVERTIVKAVAKEKLVVLATEVGLRALSYDAAKGEQVDLLLFGTEQFSTESNLQAFARVDRGNSRGARRVVVLDRAILESRVETAKGVDEALRQKFSRAGGLGIKLVDKNLDVKTMSLKDLVETAGDFGSKEGRAQSALFFINEQIKSKLIQEPLQAMIARARERAPEGSAEIDFLKGKLVDLLKSYDQREIEQGAEYTDPKQIAINAFKSGAEHAVMVLSEIANNATVSAGLRLEAGLRIRDIVVVQRTFEATIKRAGLHGQNPDYADAAFTNVSENARNNPARMVADVVIVLSDYLLPNTTLSKAAAGVKGAPQRVQSYMTSNPIRGPTSHDGFVDSLNLDAKADPAQPASETDGRLLSYTEQKHFVAAKTFHDMTASKRRDAAQKLHAAGFIDEEVANRANAKEMAVALGAAWNRNGGRDEEFDVDALLQVSSALVTAARENGQSTVDPWLVVRTALAPESAVPTARRENSVPTHRMEALAEAILEIKESAPATLPMPQPAPSSSRWWSRAAAAVFGLEVFFSADVTHAAANTTVSSMDVSAVLGSSIFWMAMAGAAVVLPSLLSIKAVWDDRREVRNANTSYQAARVVLDRTQQARRQRAIMTNAGAGGILKPIRSVMNGLSGMWAQLRPADRQIDRLAQKKMGPFSTDKDALMTMVLLLTGQSGTTYKNVSQNVGTLLELAKLSSNLLNKISFKELTQVRSQSALQTLIKNKESPWLSRDIRELKVGVVGLDKMLGVGSSLLALAGVFSIAAANPLVPMALFGLALAAKIAGPTVTLESLMPSMGQKKNSPVNKTIQTLMAPFLILSVSYLWSGTVTAGVLAQALLLPAINFTGKWIGEGALAKTPLVGGVLASVWEGINDWAKNNGSLILSAIRAVDQAKENRGKSLTLGAIVDTINADKKINLEDRANVLRAALILSGISSERVDEIMLLYDKDDKTEFEALSKRTLSELSDEDRTMDFFIRVARFETSLADDEPITPDNIETYFSANGPSADMTAHEVMDFYAGRTLSNEDRTAIKKATRQLEAFRNELAKFAETRSRAQTEANKEPATPSATPDRRNTVVELSYVAQAEDMAPYFRQVINDVLGADSPEALTFSLLTFQGAITATAENGNLRVTGLAPEGHVVIMHGEPLEMGMLLSVVRQDVNQVVGTVDVEFTQSKEKQTVINRIVASPNAEDIVPHFALTDGSLHAAADPKQRVIVYSRESKEQVNLPLGTRLIFATLSMEENGKPTAVGPMLNLPAIKGQKPYIPPQTPESAPAMVEEAATAEAPQIVAPVVPAPQVAPAVSPRLLAQQEQRVRQEMDREMATGFDANGKPVRFRIPADEVPDETSSHLPKPRPLDGQWINNLPEDSKQAVKDFLSVNQKRAEAGTPVFVAALSQNGQKEIIWGQVGNGRWIPIVSTRSSLESVRHNPMYFRRNIGPVELLVWKPGSAAPKAAANQKPSPSTRNGIATLGTLAVMATPVLAALGYAHADTVTTLASAVAPLLLGAATLPVLGIAFARTMSGKKSSITNIGQSEFDEMINKGNYARHGDTYRPAAAFNRGYNGTEKILAWQKEKYSVDGNTAYVVRPIGYFRQNVLSDEVQAKTITTPIKEMFARLPMTELDPTDRLDRSAAPGVETILNHAVYGDVARLISVKPFMTPELKAQFAQDLVSNPAPQTLGAVQSGSYSSEFKSFMYQLVAYHNQALATPNSVAVQMETIVALQKTYPGLVLQQINPGRGAAMPSLHDYGAFLGLRARFGQSHSIEMVQTNQEDGTITLYKPGQVTVINQNSERAKQTVAAQNAEQPALTIFQSLKQTGLSLISQLQNRGEKEPDANQLRVARSALNSAWEIHFEHKLKPEQIKAVWATVGEYTSNKVDAGLDNIARGTAFEGMGVDQLVRELTSQMRELARGNPAVAPLAQRNAMPLLGVQMQHHFAEVGAMPEGSALGWLAKSMLEDIETMSLVNGVGAHQRLDAMGTETAGQYEEAIQSAIALAQLGLDSAHRQSSLALGDIVREKNTDTALQEQTLKFIARGLGSPLSNISIWSTERFDNEFKGGKAAIKGDNIVIRQDKETTFLDMVVALIHDVNHPEVDRVLAKYPGQVPTMIVEALTQGRASETLRQAGHIALANRLDRVIYQRIIEQEEKGKVVLVRYYKGLSRNADILRTIEKTSNGLHRLPVLVEDNRLDAARAELGAQINLVSIGYLNSLKALPGETKIEAYTRLFFGTRNVSLMTTQALNKEVEALVSLGEDVIDQLVWMVEAIALDKLNTRFNEQEARLRNSQA